MIFATVGTHEDGFPRLVRALEGLAASGALQEPVVIQAGYTRELAPHCTVEALLPYERLQALMDAARVVVTHGGPATIMEVMARGRIPVVVPRQSAHGEHVDDHQVAFARRLGDRIELVLDVADLGPAIARAASRRLPPGSAGPERARAFALRLDALIESLCEGAGGSASSVLPESPK